MADRVLDFDDFGTGAVGEMNLQSIGDRALPRIEIIRCVLRRLGDPHFVPQRVDCGIRSVEIVFVMFRLKFAQVRLKSASSPPQVRLKFASSPPQANYY